MVLLAAILSAGLIFFLALAFLMYVRHRRRTDIFYRLKRLNILESEQMPDEGDPADRLRYMLTRLAKPIAGRGPVQALDFKMRQAGVPLLGGEFLVMLLASGCIMGIGTWMLTLDGFLAFLIGWFTVVVIWFVVSFRIRRRRTAFTEQLGDCLTTVANALRAGYSFQQAMEVIVQEMEPPISEEFSQVSKEVAMNVPLETALTAMNERIGSSDFDLVVTAVLIQREVGGNLAQILDTISDTINERIRMKREIYALTAQGRLSAWVLLLLPFAIGFFLYCFNREQLMLLFTEPMGRLALVVSFGMEVMGYVIIQRIVNIEL